MTLIRINRHPSPKQLKIFGLIWMLVFGFWGVMAYARLSAFTLAQFLGMLAVLIPVMGWLFPPFMRLAYIALSWVAFPIGLVVSQVILLVLYYVVFTPVGLLMRLVGYDPMARGFDPTTASYWQRRDPVDETKRYFRQF